MSEGRGPGLPVLPDFSPEELRGMHSIGIAISEIALCRVRERALLETLETGGFDRARYDANFERILARDYEPFVASVVLTDDAFARRYPDWIRSQTKV